MNRPMKPIDYLAAGMVAMYLGEVRDADPSYPPAVEAGETSYGRRGRRVWMAAGFAAQMGLNVGIGFDPAEPDWPVIYIELPTGQVSWHMPAHPVPYDGHTTEQKYERINQFIDWVDGEIYRNFAYVQDQCGEVVAQMAAVAGPCATRGWEPKLPEPAEQATRCAHPNHPHFPDGCLFPVSEPPELPATQLARATPGNEPCEAGDEEREVADTADEHDYDDELRREYGTPTEITE